jgi:thioester reductase-like protein
MRSFGLWEPALGARIIPVVGDLARPLLGLTRSKFEELAGRVDVIYHLGATVNFYYPYSFHKAANVLSTEELLRLASYGRSKSLHFVSTLSVALAQPPQGAAAIISEKDPLPGAPHLSDGYVQSKWVAEKMVAIAASRGIPVMTYRPGTIMGHSQTGAASLEDLVPSFIRGCMQSGCVPEGEVHNELHLMPVDYVSRSIVALSRRQDLFGRVFNLTTPHGVTGRELLDALLAYDPSLERVSYEEWRSRVADDPDNALARHIASFPDQLPKNQESLTGPQFDSEQTLSLMQDAGIARPQITQKVFQAYFSFLAQHTASRAGIAAD